jgi:hypothetical protein
MTQAIGTDIAANPVHIRLLGSQTVVFDPQTAANFVQQARTLLILFGIAYDCGFTGILHMDVSLLDNTLNVSCQTKLQHRRNPLFCVGKF